MKIKEVTDKVVWEKAIADICSHSYFQAWNWGEVEKTQNRKVWRLGVYKNNKLVGISQILKIEARRGTFLHIRHGPLLESWDKSVFAFWLKHVRLLAKNEKAWFIRISPQVETQKQEFLSGFEFINAPIHSMDAELVSVVNLEKSEDEILKAMRKNTRNLIRRAGRDGVVVRSCSIDEFITLYAETASRHGFVPHQMIEQEYRTFVKDGQVELYGAYFEKKLLATALIAYYGKQAIYHHGASIYSKIPATYRLQWAVIKRAKEKGFSEYNLYGIADTENKSHPWWGLTMFKKGFGGETRQYLHAQDLPLTPLYYITYAIEKIRKIKRGY